MLNIAVRGEEYVFIISLDAGKYDFICIMLPTRGRVEMMLSEAYIHHHLNPRSIIF